MGMNTYKVKCQCKHDFQDQEHGPGIRIATPSTKVSLDKTTRVVSCTVCSKQQTVKN